MLERLRNEIDYQRQARPESTAVAALEWSLIEIERLRAALLIAKDALERDTGNYSFVLQAITDAIDLKE